MKEVKTQGGSHYKICQNFAYSWVKLLPKNRKFTSEDIINAYKKTSMPQPEDYRVFGAVMNAIVKSKIVAFDGFDKYKGKQGHRKPCYVWVKL
jgi:deoxyribodipyrimidine photolyase